MWYRHLDFVMYDFILHLRKKIVTLNIINLSIIFLLLLLNMKKVSFDFMTYSVNIILKCFLVVF